MRRKGSSIILVMTVFTVFIPAAMFMQVMNASSLLESSAEYRSGDISMLAKSQIQKQNLQEQYRTGLRYSLNEEAFRQGESNTWGSIPDMSSIRSEFISGSQKGLNERFRTSDLSCEVETMPVLAEDFEEGSYSVQASGKSLTCSRSKAEVTNYFNSDINLEHPENRYIALADYAVRVSENFRERIEGEDVEGTGFESGSCGESMSEVKSEAIEEAKRDANSDLSYGSDAVSETEEVEGVSVDYSTAYTGSGDAEIVSSIGCCQNTETITGPNGEEREVCSVRNTKYDAEAEFTASTAELDLAVTDTENELVYSGGEENLDYNVEYFYSFN